MILCFSQKHFTKVKVGKLKEIPLGRKFVCGLISKPVCRGSHSAHHPDPVFRVGLTGDSATITDMGKAAKIVAPLFGQCV